MSVAEYLLEQEAKTFTIQEFSNHDCMIDVDYWFEDDEIVLNTAKAQLAFRTILDMRGMIVDDFNHFPNRTLN